MERKNRVFTGYHALLAAVIGVQQKNITGFKRGDIGNFLSSHVRTKDDRGFWRKIWGASGKYKPHQGPKECARRVAQGINGPHHNHRG